MNPTASTSGFIFAECFEPIPHSSEINNCLLFLCLQMKSAKKAFEYSQVLDYIELFLIHATLAICYYSLFILGDLINEECFCLSDSCQVGDAYKILQIIKLGIMEAIRRKVVSSCIFKVYSNDQDTSILVPEQYIFKIQYMEDQSNDTSFNDARSNLIAAYLNLVESIKCLDPPHLFSNKSQVAHFELEFVSQDNNDQRTCRFFRENTLLNAFQKLAMRRPVELGQFELRDKGFYIALTSGNAKGMPLDCIGKLNEDVKKMNMDYVEEIMNKADATLESPEETAEEANFIPSDCMNKTIEYEIQEKRSKVSSGNETDNFRCICSAKGSSGDLICCDYCANWVHAVCYGYLSFNDSRIPDTFRCIHCQREGDGPINIASHMTSRANMRQLIYYSILNTHAKNNEDLQEALETKSRKVKNLLLRLGQEIAQDRIFSDEISDWKLSAEEVSNLKDRYFQPIV